MNLTTGSNCSRRHTWTELGAYILLSNSSSIIYSSLALLSYEYTIELDLDIQGVAQMLNRQAGTGFGISLDSLIARADVCLHPQLPPVDNNLFNVHDQFVIFLRI